MFNNFVKFSLDRGGKIKPLIIPSNNTYWKGTGLMNPSICKFNGNLIVNIRQVNYTLYHSEKGKNSHIWGPLVYIHPENNQCLATKNFICTLNDDLDIISYSMIDTSKLDQKPIWGFHGLEDIRLVNWENKLFITGVRRDTNTTGRARMDLSEIIFDGNYVKEISRIRVPAPGDRDKTSYCEKNWMPIYDKPYSYIKWSNPTEIVSYDHSSHKTTTEFVGKYDINNHDPRGGSQALPWKGGYIALVHLTSFCKDYGRRKNGDYYHQFIVWDKDWNIVRRSKIFSFMGGRVEFSCGMCKHNDDYLITFGFQDNAAYVLSVKSTSLEEFMYAK